MKKIFVILLVTALVIFMVACGSQNSDPPTESGSNAESSQPSNSDSSDSQNIEAERSSSGEPSANTNILVVFFSHTGENYSVGVIEKGNTHIIADMIAEETGADMFEIQPENPYPTTYNECTDVAKKEQNENARPKYIDSVDNMEQYDTVFIGYPIWWGDLPMVVYTFLESYDFSGKTVIPFCTHEGSGLSGTARNVANACPGATVLDGLAIRGSVAQNKQSDARSDVVKWLNGLDY